MENMDTYSQGLDAIVAEQVSALDNTTETERFSSNFFASVTSFSLSDLAGLFAIACERLAQGRK